MNAFEQYQYVEMMRRSRNSALYRMLFARHVVGGGSGDDPAPPEPPTPVDPKYTTFHFSDSPDETYLIEGSLSFEKMVELGFINEEAPEIWYKFPTSVDIGNAVTVIDKEAFYNCQSLTSIVIPNSVTSIRIDAFSGCENLMSVTIPDSVTSIGESAFSSCKNLTSITIPNGIQVIDQQTFNDCTSLSSVTIPNSVKRILGAAFANCESLKSITIPESVESITLWAFIDCTIEITMSGKTISDVEKLNYRSWSCKSGSVIHCIDGDIQI